MAIDLTLDRRASADKAATPWAAVTCLSLLTFLLVGLEFMPVSLLTPIARDLAISEGQAGQAITVSGFFAVITSLFGNALLAKLDRRLVVLLYTAVLVTSSLAVALAPNFLIFLVGRALVGISIGGFWSLSTAILARLASGRDLPKAIALLQGGTALALVLAAPLGSFLGGLIGWRGTFLITVRSALLPSSGNWPFCRRCQQRQPSRVPACSRYCATAHSPSEWPRQASPSSARTHCRSTCAHSSKA